MSVKIAIVPCLTDNYAYILHDKLSNKTTLVDAPEFSPIKKKLDKENWTLDNILITHHHDDHIAGVKQLKNIYDPIIFGAADDMKRLPSLDVKLSDREKFSASNLIFKCLDVSGHTLGHLAFYCASENILFTGDSLMTLGCGRIFEGTPKQMLESLNKLKELPDETLIYSGHEYAKQNARFSVTIDPNNFDLKNRAIEINKKVVSQIPNVGDSLLEEKRTNPFLRCTNPDIKEALGLKNKSELEIFTTIREMKDNF